MLLVMLVVMTKVVMVLPSGAAGAGAASHRAHIVNCGGANNDNDRRKSEGEGKGGGNLGKCINALKTTGRTAYADTQFNPALETLFGIQEVPDDSHIGVLPLSAPGAPRHPSVGILPSTDDAFHASGEN